MGVEDPEGTIFGKQKEKADTTPTNRKPAYINIVLQIPHPRSKMTAEESIPFSSKHRENEDFLSRQNEIRDKPAPKTSRRRYPKPQTKSKPHVLPSSPTHGRSETQRSQISQRSNGIRASKTKLRIESRRTETDLQYPSPLPIRLPRKRPEVKPNLRLSHFFGSYN
ncbi:hypothetical protein BHE74_00036507 [Ensete ventricosum]|uniref:Uncharacterized protein n=1 Tax=Ensete ventricosum TaxID=4639 RepID=A0A444D7U5_ENSVE|nr:hypothetical protein B296_00046027 [Ensete ventricosum]RWV94216.1 hypothetical protein GW17_00043268 [Ensete ventricosum]RWW56755.1 hypothetical protein BHE74_00036507 [Ensete ventricosum]RZS07868.1 hypothetical protein BHM03_00038768 [Ensete ventricosum]